MRPVSIGKEPDLQNHTILHHASDCCHCLSRCKRIGLLRMDINDNECIHRLRLQFAHLSNCMDWVTTGCILHHKSDWNNLKHPPRISGWWFQQLFQPPKAPQFLGMVESTKLGSNSWDNYALAEKHDQVQDLLGELLCVLIQLQQSAGGKTMEKTWKNMCLHFSVSLMSHWHTETSASQVAKICSAEIHST
jgi:hypothetical protein